MRLLTRLAISQLASKIYYGVPRFTGGLLRATRTPSIVILLGAFAVPVLFAIIATVSVIQSHSNVMTLYPVVGMWEIRLDINPDAVSKAPPFVEALLLAATPEQRDTAKTLTEILIVDSAIVLFTLPWWAYRAFQFSQKMLLREQRLAP
jgi:hypothetical protein